MAGNETEAKEISPNEAVDSLVAIETSNLSEADKLRATRAVTRRTKGGQEAVEVEITRRAGQS